MHQEVKISGDKLQLEEHQRDSIAKAITKWIRRDKSDDDKLMFRPFKISRKDKRYGLLPGSLIEDGEDFYLVAHQPKDGSLEKSFLPEGEKAELGTGATKRTKLAWRVTVNGAGKLVVHENVALCITPVQGDFKAVGEASKKAWRGQQILAKINGYTDLRLFPTPQIREISPAKKSGPKYKVVTIKPRFPGKELFDWIFPRHCSDEQYIKILVAIILAMKLAHEIGIVLLDIKPENIICDRSGEKVALIDTEDAIELQGKNKIEIPADGPPCGTAGYIDPRIGDWDELDNPIYRYTKSSDLHSVSQILFLMFSMKSSPKQEQQYTAVFNIENIWKDNRNKGTPDYLDQHDMEFGGGKHKETLMNLVEQLRKCSPEPGQAERVTEEVLKSLQSCLSDTQSTAVEPAAHQALHM